MRMITHTHRKWAQEMSAANFQHAKMSMKGMRVTCAHQLPGRGQCDIASPSAHEAQLLSTYNIRTLSPPTRNSDWTDCLPARPKHMMAVCGALHEFAHCAATSRALCRSAGSSLKSTISSANMRIWIRGQPLATNTPLHTGGFTC